MAHWPRRRPCWPPAARRRCGSGPPTPGGRSEPAPVLAAAAGADLADLEFCQFHPTALALPGTRFDGMLITEAVRGEGATLLDAAGRRFTDELAPRDAVTAAILARMEADGSSHVQLDLRPVDPARFPSIFASLAEAGLDARSGPVPVAPASHYVMGGIAVDLDGRASLPGLYAVGECACTGLHGANRLASNSLSECFVFGGRAAAAALEETGGGRAPAAAGVALRAADRGDPRRGLAPRRAGAPPGGIARAARRPLPTGRRDRRLRPRAARVARRPPARRLPRPRPRARRRPHRPHLRRDDPPRGVALNHPTAVSFVYVLLGVDVGGTFTDAVLFDGATLHTAKAPTTPGEESVGTMAAIEEVLRRGRRERRRRRVLLPRDDRRHQRAARRARRPHCADRHPRLRRPAGDRPPEPPRPLPPLRAEAGAAGRAGAALRGRGADRPGGHDRTPRRRASRSGWRRRCASPAPSRLRSACSSLMWIPRTNGASPSTCVSELPGVHVSASHEVLPRFREYERCSTTAIDAYLSPLLGRYLSRLGDAAADAGLPRPLVMRSSGGVTGAEEAARAGAWSVLSGPAGGAVGASLLARISGDGNALGFDMGGTSCDVCVVEDGKVRRTDSRTIGGRVIQLPMVDVHTVGAGGGSVGWRDPGGALRVGPRSAGADPGPACYGRGGAEPTVTDANLLLGLPGGRLASWPAGSPSISTRRGPQSHASRIRSGWTSWRPPKESSASPTRRWCGRCAWSRSSAASTRAASRCCPSAAPGRCTPPRSPPSLESSESSARVPAASSLRSASAPRIAVATPPAR